MRCRRDRQPRPASPACAHCGLIARCQARHRSAQQLELLHVLRGTMGPFVSPGQRTALGARGPTFPIHQRPAGRRGTRQWGVLRRPPPHPPRTKRRNSSVSLSFCVSESSCVVPWIRPRQCSRERALALRSEDIGRFVNTTWFSRSRPSPAIYRDNDRFLGNYLLIAKRYCRRRCAGGPLSVTGLAASRDARRHTAHGCRCAMSLSTAHTVEFDA